MRALHWGVHNLHKMDLRIACKHGCVFLLMLCVLVSGQIAEQCPDGCDCTQAGKLSCRKLTKFPRPFSYTAGTVSISMSSMPSIPSHAFVNVTGIKVIDMHGVTIGAIEPCAFDNLDGMTRISIYNGNIRTIRAGAFNGMAYHGYFSLFMSDVDTIESYAFNNISISKSFSIFQSNVTLIQPRAFYDFSDMKKFSIYSSNITTIKSSAFSNFLRIETVDFHENTIAVLECDTVESLVKQFGRNFSFDHMTLNCDCQSVWLLNESLATPGLSLNTTVCHLPLPLKGTSLATLKPDQFCSPGQAVTGQCVQASGVFSPVCRVIETTTTTTTSTGATTTTGPRATTPSVSSSVRFRVGFISIYMWIIITTLCM